MNPRVQHKLGRLFSSWEAHMLYGLAVSGPSLWLFIHILPETRIAFSMQSSRVYRVSLVKQPTPQLFTLNCSRGIYNLSSDPTFTGTHTSLLIQRDFFSSHPARPSSRRQTCLALRTPLTCPVLLLARAQYKNSQLANWRYLQTRTAHCWNDANRKHHRWTIFLLSIRHGCKHSMMHWCPNYFLRRNLLCRSLWFSGAALPVGFPRKSSVLQGH